MSDLIELIDLLEETCVNLITGEKQQYSVLVQKVINSCLEVFPKIIVTYSDPKMADLSSEATYWPSQFERIISVVNADDEYAVYDVLYCETRENLKYISKEIESRGANYGNI